MYLKPVPDRLYRVIHGVNELKKCEELWNRIQKIAKQTKVLKLMRLISCKYYRNYVVEPTLKS